MANDVAAAKCVEEGEGRVTAFIAGVGTDDAECAAREISRALDFTRSMKATVAARLYRTRKPWNSPAAAAGRRRWFARK